jgi:hypothetical protein
MPNEIITSDGEVIDQAIPDQSLAIGMTRAEIDQQIATARAFPRSIKRATEMILSLVTLNEETSEECIYALPRGGKPITGPSIRMAEIIQQCWGNNRTGARVVHVDRTEKYVEAEGVYHDLETNSATLARVRRRISDKNGKILSDDMIIVTGNAVCSIAKRNAILGGVPKPVWRQAEDAARKIVSGSIETLTVTRDKSMSAFSRFGVKPEQIFVALGVQGLDDIGLDAIPILRGMFAALKNGEATVEEMFSPRNIGGIAHKVVANPLSDDAPAGAAEPAKTDKSASPADAPKTAAPAPAGTPAQPNTTNSPIAATASPDNGAQADPEKPLQNVRSGSATDQAPQGDDDFPGDRPSTAATKAAGRKFIKNLAE